jgi:hypothetical protein
MRALQRGIANLEHQLNQVRGDRDAQAQLKSFFVGVNKHRDAINGLTTYPLCFLQEASLDGVVNDVKDDQPFM